MTNLNLKEKIEKIISLPTQSAKDKLIYEWVKTRVITLSEYTQLVELTLKSDWIKVTDRLPEPNQQVIRFTPNVNISQERMAVGIIDGHILKFAEEDTYWMPIPELPVPLKIN